MSDKQYKTDIKLGKFTNHIYTDHLFFKSLKT